MTSSMSAIMQHVAAVDQLFLRSVGKEFLQDSACGIQHKESTATVTLYPALRGALMHSK